VKELRVNMKDDFPHCRIKEGLSIIDVDVEIWSFYTILCYTDPYRNITQAHSI
jgi:hypothetical protein